MNEFEETNEIGKKTNKYNVSIYDFFFLSPQIMI